MPTYGVVMNEAVSMVALGANVLCTGYKTGEYLYSCSAIIVANPGTGAAGLYHFPSGDIYEDFGSRAVIRALIADVAPTEAAICYGTVDYRNPLKPPDEPADAGEINSLQNWLQGQLQFPVTLYAATRGSAAVSIAAGNTQIFALHGANVTDLDGYLAGDYPAGFKVYWKPKIRRRHSVSF